MALDMIFLNATRDALAFEGAISRLPTAYLAIIRVLLLNSWME